MAFMAERPAAAVAREKRAPSNPRARQKAEARKPAFRVTPEMVVEAGRKVASYKPPGHPGHPFFVQPPPPGVLPVGADGLAMDEAPPQSVQIIAGWAGGYFQGGAFDEGITFLGYPYLAQLAQRPEYRVISETIATEMTRKWIRLQAEGDEGAKADRIKELNDELDRLQVRDRFRESAEQDGFFGRAHIYLDTGETDDRDELKTSIGDGRDVVSKAKIRKGSLKSVRTVEAVWTYPTSYNSTDPLKPDWYQPTNWFVMGKEIHRSRLLKFVGREVPDLLKPAYSFGGLSLSQMAKPYVDNWLRTRQSVADLVHSFVVLGLKTDMESQLQPGGNLQQRLELFNRTRDNRGVMVMDKNSEDFFNVTTALGTLDVLQAQTQEHMAAVSRIPLVKLTGISPHGLNASSEGEIRVFYDTIKAYQEAFFTPNLRRVIDFAMLNLWGEVDATITFAYEPLWSLDEKGEAEVREIEARTGQIHIDTGVISQAEERKRVAGQPDGPYQGLDVDDLPDLQQEKEEGLEPGAGKGGDQVVDDEVDEGNMPAAIAARANGANGHGGHLNGAGEHEPTGRELFEGLVDVIHKGLNDNRRGGERRPGERRGDDRRDDDRRNPDRRDTRRGGMARDEAGDWSEEDHPRQDDGKFGKGGGGSGGGKVKPESKEDPLAGVKKFLSGQGHGLGQIPHAPQYGLQHGKFTAGAGSSSSSSSIGTFTPAPPKKGTIGEPIDPSKLKKVGKQMGSNPGGVYEDEAGKKFYVKQGKSKDHVRNEMIAARLYELAGTPTLKYRPVENGEQIATEMEKLDKDNASKLSPAEIAEAREDFAVHAWLGNWDVVGLGGDNLGTINGKPTPLDLGGAMEYRAQGAPKGKAFGTKVGEIATLRDKQMNSDAAGVFGGMTPAEMRASARHVTKLSDEKIRKAVDKLGGSAALADKLIARRDDLAEQAKTFGAEGDPKKPTGTMVVPVGTQTPIKKLNGIDFSAWSPPDDWASVDGQADIAEPDLEVPAGKEAASGVVIREPDGRIWMVQPRGGFGGYDATFPKGRAEKGLSLQANAIKEAYEESGLKVRITGHAGDHAGDTTMTRYYYAEREAGDPAQHEDETEGVVLAPAGKAAGFLNRARDQKILSSVDSALGADEGPFKEDDHPRDDDGKFSSTGGGGGAAAKPAQAAAKPEGLKHFQASTSSFDHSAKVSKILSEPAKKSHTYRWILNKLISEAEQFNSGTAPGLKMKIVESWTVVHADLKGKGDDAEAKKVEKKILSLTGGKPAAAPSAPLPPVPQTPAEKKAAAAHPIENGPPQNYAEFKDQLVKAIADKNAEVVQGLTKYNTAWAKQWAEEKSTAEALMKPKAPAVPAFPPPTDAELAKAKKNVALQLQYVPGAPQGSAAAQKLVDAFNAKYANKEMKTQPELIQKVNDFKMLAAAMGPLQNAEQKAAAAAQNAQAAKQAEANKAQTEALKTAQAEAKAKNASYMKELGISETEATGFHALVDMLGKNSSSGDLVAQFKGYQQTAVKYGYPISGFQFALISSYIDGGYGAVNKAMRSGSMSAAQHVYAKIMNNALEKMPKYTGNVIRGTSLTAEQIAKYKPGHVVREDAFTSTGKGYSFGGNVSYSIKATGGRGVDFSTGANQGEKEVIFKSNTFFMVHKVTKKGDTTHVEMEEVEGHG